MFQIQGRSGRNHQGLDPNQPAQAPQSPPPALNHQVYHPPLAQELQIIRILILPPSFLSGQMEASSSPVQDDIVAFTTDFC